MRASEPARPVHWRTRQGSRTFTRMRDAGGFTFTRAGIRAVDRAAIDELGIPGIVLMENAAASLERACLDLFTRELGGPRPFSRVEIVCGPGNNGGDGFALARRLHVAGVRPRILACAPRERFTGDARINLECAVRLALDISWLPDQGEAAVKAALTEFASVGARGGAVASRTLIIDALFGTGLDRPVAGAAASVIAWINRRRKAEAAFVLAVDIPSGLDCERGEPLGSAVEADHTVTLCGRKRGFNNPASRAFTGDVSVGSIGVPQELLARFADR